MEMLLFKNGAHFRFPISNVLAGVICAEYGTVNLPNARMNEDIAQEVSLDETARKLTEDIENMSNYKALYNEIQVSSYLAAVMTQIITSSDFEMFYIFFHSSSEARCVVHGE